MRFSTIRALAVQWRDRRRERREEFPDDEAHGLQRWANMLAVISVTVAATVWVATPLQDVIIETETNRRVNDSQDETLNALEVRQQDILDRLESIPLPE